ncbi:MAG: hypothetical protein CM1200mP5_1820 [Candidatus Pelagibacterales bacterium]|nr:MAG: hypothetical protein CM1200mP5_1820 [Pelagibacterales bacterium]
MQLLRNPKQFDVIVTDNFWRYAFDEAAILNPVLWVFYHQLHLEKRKMEV